MNFLEFSVSRALVSPKFYMVVVHFLNHRLEETTVYKKCKIASMELLEVADLPATSVKKRQPSLE